MGSGEDAPALDAERDISAVLAEVGSRIRAARLDRGMSQQELGERLGVSQAAVSNWEGSRRMVTVDNLIDVARVLGVDPAELLPEDSPPASPEPALTAAERAAAALFAPSCIHPAEDPCDECADRARDMVAAVAPALAAECSECAKSEGELLSVAAVINVARSGRSPFAAPMIEKGSLAWEVAEAISRGRHRGLAGVEPTPAPESV